MARLEGSLFALGGSWVIVGGSWARLGGSLGGSRRGLAEVLGETWSCCGGLVQGTRARPGGWQADNNTHTRRRARCSGG